MKTRSLVLFLLMILAALPARASHYMGGEISWECLPNGNFRFILRVYRECYTAIGSPSVSYGIWEHITGPFGDISMYQYPDAIQGKKDISPVCHPQSAPHYACGLVGSGMSANLGAIQEWTYSSDQANPNGVTLNGVPPANGWTFYWDGCCRNSAVNYSGQPNWYISAKMYPFNGLNASPCYDNSPRFQSVPPTSIPIGYPFSFNLDIQDKDRDSLSFAFTPSLTGASAQIPYINPYSGINPFPGPTHNSQNVPAAIDPVTGEFTFTSFTQGAYIAAIKASSYRNGVLIAEVTREIQIALLPNAIVDYPNTTIVQNFPPEIVFQTQSMGPSITADTIWAGEYLEYDITAFDTLPPLLLAPVGTLNGMTFHAAGVDFGYGFTSDTAGCPDPPCATLDPAPDSINTLPNFLVLNSKFRWQTDCSHTGWMYGKSQKTHVFSFAAADMACPVPASNGYTYTVVVKDPVLDPPNLHTPVGGNPFMFGWSPPDTTQMPNHFNGYFIYLALVQGGPFVLIDSLSTYTDTIYTYTPPYVNGTKYVAFYVRTRSGCSGMVLSSPSDTIWDIIVGTEELAQVSEQRPAFHQDITSGELRFRVSTPGTYALEVRNLQGQRNWSCPARHYASGDHAVDWPAGTPARGLYIASAISPRGTVHSKVLLQ